jgi:hypothetical protein
MDRVRPSTDLCGPEPAGGAGPAYSLMVVAPSKLSVLSDGKGLLGVLVYGRERNAY